MPLKLYEALDQMAQLMLRHDKLHRDAVIRYTPRPEGPVTPAIQKINEQLHEIDRAINRLAECCAANPLLHPHMMCWMIDITGQSDAGDLGEVGSVQATKAINELVNKPSEFAARNGGLMLTVRTALEENGFKITDAGAGVGRWDLGVPCDDVGAMQVCHLLHARFHAAIKAEILTVRRRFWRWRFRQLYNTAAAVAYLKSRQG